MSDREDTKATMTLLLVVGLILGIPATGMTVWTAGDGSWAFWSCLVVACVCALMVLVSAIAYAVSLGRAAR